MPTTMMTGQILLMRHAEKPDDASNVHLSPAGLQRAGRLASYIPQTFGKPDFLFAAADSEQSRRPVETIEPLSQATGVPIDSTVANGHHDFLANELMTKPRYEGQRIVICWHHESMRHFSRELGGAKGDCPDPWAEDLFNLILQFDYQNRKATVQRIIEPF